MWNGKKKAVTFSFDDGTKQDERAIAILDKYGLKATFNLSSGLFGVDEILIRNDMEVEHFKVPANEVKERYKNHEVAVHTLTHPRLTEIEDEEEIVRQVEENRRTLEKLVGYPVVGMAYPCGGVNHDDRVVDILARRTGVKYARTVTSTYSFAPQKDYLQFDPTVYYIEVEKLFALAKQFVESKEDTDQIFYIWGHTFELDGNTDMTWEMFEKFCAYIANREDIFYGTNTQVLL